MLDIFQLLKPYQKAFDSLVETSVKCVKESILETEKDLGRKLSTAEYDLCSALGVVVCACKILSYMEKK